MNSKERLVLLIVPDGTGSVEPVWKLGARARPSDCYVSTLWSAAAHHCPLGQLAPEMMNDRITGMMEN